VNSSEPQITLSEPDPNLSKFKAKIDNLPGGPLIWGVFWMEMLTFAFFFWVFAWLSRSEQAVFQSGQALLHPSQATFNTLVLLTGSWMVARAVASSRQNQAVRPWLLGTGVSGVLFIAVKIWEYQQVYSHGISLSTNTFWFFYLFLTLLHNAHVALGVGFMFYLAWKYKTTKLLEEQIHTLEAAAIYWHLVDVIWVILFPLIYFTR
jgi:nitric oxide reductase NorE protein